MENQDFELVFVDNSDTDNASEIMSEKKELANYSYISNGLYFEYFVGYEIATLLGYKNPARTISDTVSKCNQLEFRDYPGIKKPEINPKAILITRDGAIEILIKTRKRISPDVLYFLKSFGIVTTNRKTLTKEQQTLSALTNSFKTEKFEDQFKVGRYYLDLYFPEYKIVVECDENGHADRKPHKERERMDFVNEKLGLTDDNWIRFNPDAEDFDISKVIGKIYTRINLLKSVQIQELLHQISVPISLPAPNADIEDDSNEIVSTSSRPKTAPKKKCIKCEVNMSVRKFYLRANMTGYVLPQPADGNKYTETEITEIQSKYRGTCRKCCNKRNKEKKKELNLQPFLNNSECKSCNNMYKNELFFINKDDKSILDECIECYLKNNNLPDSKQCVNCLEILPHNDYHIHTKGVSTRKICKTCRNKSLLGTRKCEHIKCEFCKKIIKGIFNLKNHQKTISCLQFQENLKKENINLKV
jgi:very-short-patch-repair endonuclease